MNKLFVFILIFSLGCKSQKEQLTSNNQVSERDEMLTYVISDNYGGTDMPELMVIKDAGALKRFFLKVNMTRKPGLAVPEIDFSKEMVILYCGGKKTGDQIPSLQLVEDTEHKLTFSEERSAISADTTTAAALTHPFVLYRLPITEKEIVLVPDK